VTALEKVLRSQPGVAQAKEFLISAHGGRAQTLCRLGRYREALSDWDRVLALAPEAACPSYRLERADVLIRVGDLSRAAAEADVVADAKNVEPINLFQAACLQARIGSARSGQPNQAQAHASRAMALLLRAHAAGFFKTPREASYLKDPDLSSLEERADFQVLLREVFAPGTRR
jgi:tetratricopeptide (TPR) repeat protein